MAFNTHFPKQALERTEGNQEWTIQRRRQHCVQDTKGRQTTTKNITEKDKQHRPPPKKTTTKLPKFGIQINTKQVRGYIVFTIGYSALR